MHKFWLLLVVAAADVEADADADATDEPGDASSRTVRRTT